MGALLEYLARPDPRQWSRAVGAANLLQLLPGFEWVTSEAIQEGKVEGREVVADHGAEHEVRSPGLLDDLEGETLLSFGVPEVPLPAVRAVKSESSLVITASGRPSPLLAGVQQAV